MLIKLIVRVRHALMTYPQQSYDVSVHVYTYTKISPNMERKLEATEMWFHRRMLHISWKDHVTNDEVLRRGRTERKLTNRIRAGQMSFLGHIMRKHGLENIVVTGKIEGERSRGRPRLNFMKSLSQLLKISEVEIIERTRNREEWKTMTANVRIGYGT